MLANGYFPFVFIGIGFYLFNYDNFKDKTNILLLISLLISIVAIAFSSLINLVYFLINSGLIFLAVIKKCNFLEKLRFIIFLGDASFSIYLIHQNLGYIFINLLIKNINYYICLPLAILFAFSIGIIFYLLIEKNIKRLLKHFG